MAQLLPPWQPELIQDTAETCNVVEWCRAAGMHDLLVAGTYQLHEQARHTGSLTLVQQGKVQTTYALDAGVFDARWHPREAVLAVADTEGKLACWQAVVPADQPHASAVLECPAAAAVRKDGNPAKAMATGVAWSDDGARLAACFSDGHVGVVQRDLGTIDCWPAHEAIEAWSVAWMPEQETTLLSGADDALLCVWDTRTQSRVARVRQHDAGVCAIASRGAHRIITGSYDQHVREWDARVLRQPVSALDTGGGVWRVRCAPQRSDVIAAACMQDGFKTLVMPQDQACWRVHAECRDTASLAYGIDWALDVPGRLATASFYDKQFRVAAVSLPIVADASAAHADASEAT